FVNKSTVVKEFKFKNNTPIGNIKPEYLMLYTNIIESCIVGNEYVKLLKIGHYIKHQRKITKLKNLDTLSITP
ncbi:MAG: hypothetical protein Q8O34_05115, partial [Rhodocyclaceae bacterium]|nr:hypothetical protein [Rhodocyclaceae bacterium]